jgi:hypothetical protein
MEIVEFDKFNKKNDNENIIELEDWLSEFKNSKKIGHLAFFIKEGNSKSDREIIRRIAFDRAEGPALLGCLELIKNEIIKLVINGD